MNHAGLFFSRSYNYNGRHRRPNSLSLFQKIVLDVFMSFIDPY